MQQEAKKPRKISTYNMKGGLGKSTLTGNLAHALALLGYKTLFIECDMQRNASSILQERPKHTLTDVLTEKITLPQAIHQARENYFLVQADRNLDEAAHYIVMKGWKAYTHFKRAVQELTTYDFILFDYSPSWSAVTEAALLASDELLVPCELEPYSIDGLIEMFHKLREKLDEHKLEITGITPTKVDFTSTMTHQYLQQLKETFKEKVTPIIRQDKQFPRSQAYRKTIFEFNPKSKAAQDITELAKFFTNGGNNNG